AKIETGDSFIKIFGPSKLKGATVEALDAVSGMGLILAGLGAKGKTEVHNGEIVETEFENPFLKLQSLGVDISN
ncbi:MAG: UDP-N-acetylglucosamine 1-carboxyvinyltransferase, partial [bacterium]